ncbi:MAG: hypothetical protein U0Y68_19725 [Blastocatellia bacterium]
MLIALLLVFAWFGLGNLVTRMIPPETNSFALLLSWQLALGAALWSLSWFALGTAGLLRRGVALGLLLAGLGLGVWAAKTWQEKAWSRGERETSWLWRGAFAWLAVPLGCGLLAALAPATGKDALVYRLAVPKAYVAAGGIVDVGTNVYGYLSLGAEMHGVWAMLLGQFINARVAEAAFGVVAFVWLPVLLLAVYGVARDWQLSRVWAVLATVLVATIPSFYQVAATGCGSRAGLVRRASRAVSGAMVGIVAARAPGRAGLALAARWRLNSLRCLPSSAAACRAGQSARDAKARGSRGE